MYFGVFCAGLWVGLMGRAGGWAVVCVIGWVVGPQPGGWAGGGGGSPRAMRPSLVPHNGLVWAAWQRFTIGCSLNAPVALKNKKNQNLHIYLFKKIYIVYMLLAGPLGWLWGGHWPPPPMDWADPHWHGFIIAIARGSLELS